MQVSLVRSDPVINTIARVPRTPVVSDGVPAPVAPLRADEPAQRPSRIGGAPLSGVLAVGAYQLTAAVSGAGILGRIDEYV